MKNVHASLDEQPLFFDGGPSPLSELQRRFLHPAVNDDWEFRTLIDEPEVLAKAWRRTSSTTSAAA